MEAVFFTFLFLGAYPYALYPLLAFLMSRLFSKPWEQRPITPSISLIISVYNEERVIANKIQNSLALTYPPDLLEIIVTSDGSTDATDEVVRSFCEPRLVLMASPERSGKTACLNRTVPKAKGDIVVFTDANAMFPPEMLSTVARNFTEEEVGLVTGWTKYGTPDRTEETPGTYSRLEKFTKYSESLVSSCVGADGAIFAMRRWLYQPLRSDDINDFVLPLQVVAHGKRVVLDPELFCFERSTGDPRKEFARQARITNRTTRAILRNKRFLNPFVFKSFSLFLASHKLLRFLSPVFFSFTLLISLLLAPRSPFYTICLMGHLLFVTLGLAGARIRKLLPIASVCRLLLITFAAQLVGLVRFLTGKPDTMWTPHR
jgi:cellulose synthase/poly-beta-1,6-N-acetylglucosamine synthase-like glycosyltransferase